MTSEEYQQVGQLFDEIRALPDEEQRAAVAAAFASNAELHRELLRMIEADRDSSGRFLGRCALDDAAKALAKSYTGPASGTVIGKYRLGSQIGAGGMGIVYEGHDLHLDRRVAIKILPVLANEGTERVRRFQREARAASTLNHPHIVSIYDADCDQGYHYIVMEFVEGQTLRQIVRAQNVIDVGSILDWVSQTASALSASHGAGIVHRDIKPENIMVRPDGFVKVLDFGLAKLREPGCKTATGSELETRSGIVAGTVQYLSPEQVLGEQVSAQSDLFSLGVVAYELVTGVRPFEGLTDGAVMNAIVNQTPPPPSKVRAGVSVETDALIMKALEKSPEGRFQTAAELRESCRRISSGYTIAKIENDPNFQTPSTPDRAEIQAGLAPDVHAKRWRSSRWRKVILSALIGLAAASLAFLWLNQPPPEPRVLQIAQVTGDRLRKEFFVNDGTRLYYSAGTADAEARMFQISIKGGEPAPLAGLTGMFPLDISPDRSELLLAQYMKGTVNGPFPIWVADTVGSAPRRLGGLTALDARWSPKRDEIVYSTGQDLRIARSDGTDERKVATMAGVVKYPAWSPNARSIRFTLLAMNAVSLWEVRPDGSHLHLVFPNWVDHFQDRGLWTPDEKYFVFSARQLGGPRELWAVRERHVAWNSKPSDPVRLVNGPMVSYHPEVSPDGRRIFFLGNPNRGELVRYERTTDQWEPYLGGVAAMQVDYSRDGKSITYASCPDGAIWRAAADGTERRQLTPPPLFARNPRWSPDGSQITFYGAMPGRPDRIYVVPATGGAMRQLTHGEGGPSGDEDSSWSADGKSIAFGAQSADQRQKKLPLRILDLKTMGIKKLPGTNGLWSPRWSPDGRHIAALAFPIPKIMLYDVATQKTTELTKRSGGFPIWSPDSQYIYFEDSAVTSWARVRVSTGRVEDLANLKGLKLAGPGLGWVGPGPGGMVLSTRDPGGTEIYSLDWDAQ